jgi:hypothetical protein
LFVVKEQAANPVGVTAQAAAGRQAKAGTGKGLGLSRAPFLTPKGGRVRLGGPDPIPVSWRSDMLALSRKPGEKIVIGGGITITVLEAHGDRVRVGIEASLSSCHGHPGPRPS